MTSICKNYTGKIHNCYATSTNIYGPARASCNQDIVCPSALSEEAIHAADESQFCGRCFHKIDGSRKNHALRIFALNNQ